MSGSYPGPALPTSVTRHLHRQGHGQDRLAPARRDPDCTRRASPRWSAPICARGGSISHRPGALAARGRGRVHRGRHALAARRRPCGPVLRLRRRARDRAAACSRRRGGDQVDRADRHRRRGRAHPARAASRRRIPRGVEPGISARGRGDPRLQASRPHRGRQRRQPRARDAGRDLSPALPQRRADPLHRAAHRRADQVCGERVPGDEDHLHQRDRRPVREGRRQRAGGRARHRPRQPHRREISPRRDPAMAAPAFRRTRWR